MGNKYIISMVQRNGSNAYLSSYLKDGKKAYCVNSDIDYAIIFDNANEAINCWVNLSKSDIEIFALTCNTDEVYLEQLRYLFTPIAKLLCLGR